MPRQDADNDRATFDQFLDQHKDIAKDLRDKPGRLNDPDYLKNHKELQTFFDRNPRAKEELRQDPAFFTRRENRFETNATPKQRADRDDFLAKHKDIAGDLDANPGLVNDNDYLRRHKDLQTFLDKDPGMRDELRNRADNDRNRADNDRNRADNDRNQSDVAGNARGNPNPDLTRQELATMDQFLDSHPDIDQQLRANPKLIDDQNYMRAHPQLQAFFAQNPVVQNEFRENPNYFMRRENRFDARNPDTNLTERQRRDRDDFMAKHKDIDRDLQANPGLANDNDYLNRHRDFRAFLDKDPDVREDYRHRSEGVENGRPGAVDRDRDRDRDASLTPKQRADRDDFMAKHKDIDRDLQANPALVNDNDYLNRHRDLRAFLDKDPDVRERVRANPSTIVPAKTENTPARNEAAPARTERPKDTDNRGKNSDVKSDKADIKSDKADINRDKANKNDKADIKADRADVKSDKADIKSDKADVKADKPADKDKPKRPSKPSDTKPPIEQREEAQPSH
jgi:hypothetical protein